MILDQDQQYGLGVVWAWDYAAVVTEVALIPVGSWATTDRQTDWTQQTHRTDFGHKARETAWTIGE